MMFLKQIVLPISVIFSLVVLILILFIPNYPNVSLILVLTGIIGGIPVGSYLKSYWVRRINRSLAETYVKNLRANDN